jgi:DNA-binding GntR family transcriptional regulator
MMVFSQIRALNLREQVAEQVRTAIIEGRLKPNDHITEATLTEQLGVSRTPVREALILLEREELVVSIPNRGFFVRAFEEEDISALFSMRITLENFAAELVINRLIPEDFAQLAFLIERQAFFIAQDDFKQVRSADMAFHQHLVRASRHPLLMRSWEEIVAQVAAVLYLRAEGNPDVDEHRAISDHQSIVDAYRAHDLERVKSENRRINHRVEQQCIEALRTLRARQTEVSPPR